MSSQLFGVHHTPRLSGGGALAQEVTLSLHYFALIKGNGIMPLHFLLYCSEKNSLVSKLLARNKGMQHFPPMRISLNSVEEGIMRCAEISFFKQFAGKFRPRGRSESALLKAGGCSVKINCAQSISR
jgi:hypothetical protein